MWIMRMLFFWLAVSFLATDFASEAFDVEAATIEISWDAVTENADGTAITDLVAYETCVDFTPIPDNATLTGCTVSLGVPNTQTTADVGVTIPEGIERVYVRVRAKNTTGKVGAWSVETSAAVPAIDITTPGQVNNVTIIRITLPN